jgi:hypothetical protein
MRSNKSLLRSAKGLAKSGAKSISVMLLKFGWKVEELGVVVKVKLERRGRMRVLSPREKRPIHHSWPTRRRQFDNVIDVR